MTMTEAELEQRLCRLLPSGSFPDLKLHGNLAIITVYRNNNTRRSTTVLTRKLEADPDAVLKQAVEFLNQRHDLVTHRGEDHWAPSGAIWTYIKRIS